MIIRTARSKTELCMVNQCMVKVKSLCMLWREWRYWLFHF